MRSSVSYTAGVCCRDGPLDALRLGWADAWEDYLARPIRVVTPFPAEDQRYGDPHRVRERLRPRLGQLIIVEGEGGRGGGHRHVISWPELLRMDIPGWPLVRAGVHG